VRRRERVLGDPATAGAGFTGPMIGSGSASGRRGRRPATTAPRSRSALEDVDAIMDVGERVADRAIRLIARTTPLIESISATMRHQLP
jgi:hypothetical protein